MNSTGVDREREDVLRRVYDEFGFDLGDLPPLPKSTQRLIQSEMERRRRERLGRRHACIQLACVPPLSTHCRVRPDLLSMGGLVGGAAGSGKSYFLENLIEQWSADFTDIYRTVRLIDPKGETFELMALRAACDYLLYGDRDGQALFAKNFSVDDVRKDRLTPANLYAVAPDMAPDVLAQIRAAMTMEAFGGEWSELMQFGVELLNRIVIALGNVGLTSELVEGFFFNRAFRETALLPRLADPHLRADAQAVESTLPEVTRQAITRRYRILFASRAARVLYGLSPVAYSTLLPERLRASVRLQNFGPSLLRPPTVALAQAMNATVDAITEVMMQEGARPGLLIAEEAAQLVRSDMVARYLLDASRTLRWKGLTLVCCAQDPTNAFPREVLRTLALNARWFALFQCAKEDVSLIEPYFPTQPSTIRVNFALSAAKETADRDAAVRRMLTLPRQHCVLYLKGESPFILKTRTLDDPVAESGMSRADLLAVFYDEIARFSMVRYEDAERLIEEETRTLFGGGGVVSAATPRLTIDNLLNDLAHARVLPVGSSAAPPIDPFSR